MKTTTNDTKKNKQDKKGWWHRFFKEVKAPVIITVVIFAIMNVVFIIQGIYGSNSTDVIIGDYRFLLNKNTYKIEELDDGSYGIFNIKKGVMEASFSVTYDISAAGYSSIEDIARGGYIEKDLKIGFVELPNAYKAVIKLYNEITENPEDSFAEYDIILFPKNNESSYLYRFNLFYGKNIHTSFDLYAQLAMAISSITGEDEPSYYHVITELRNTFTQKGFEIQPTHD